MLGPLDPPWPGYTDLNNLKSHIIPYAELSGTKSSQSPEDTNRVLLHICHAADLVACLHFTLTRKLSQKLRSSFARCNDRKTSPGLKSWLTRNNNQKKRAKRKPQ